MILRRHAGEGAPPAGAAGSRRRRPGRGRSGGTRAGARRRRASRRSAATKAGLLAFVLLAPLAALLTLDPIAQSAAYHDFADRRTWFGVPNFADVASSLPFLVLGLWGAAGSARWVAGEARRSWRILFVAVALVGPGSAYYHLDPGNDTLLWDRLPMGIAFMALFTALLAERVDPRCQRFALAPALALGAGAALYGYLSDDLRLWIWVQFAALLAIPALAILYPARYTRGGALLFGLGCYAAAKLVEFADLRIFEATAGALSGHTLKHLIAALAPLAVHLMLIRRRPLAPADAAPGSGFPLSRE